MVCIAVALAGCESFGQVRDAVSEAEVRSNFSYIPLDPLPVSATPGANCTSTPDYLTLLDALPDNAVRIAIGKFTTSGSLSFGVGSTGFEGERFRVVLDYINADTANMRFALYRRDATTNTVYGYFDEAAKSFPPVVDRLGPAEAVNGRDERSEVVIPVYVGVGLRLTADLTVLQGEVQLSSLGALAADARAGNISGTMVVQTLGVTGKQVATSLPLPSSLDETTVQQAILSLGSIKAIMYDTAGENVVLTPRVTGIYNPIQGGETLVNAIVSELARSPVEWERGCEVATTANG